MVAGSGWPNQGILYIYGKLSESDTQIPVLEFYPKVASIKGYGLPSITLHDTRRKAAVEYVVKGLASGAVVRQNFSRDQKLDGSWYRRPERLRVQRTYIFIY